MFLFQLLQLILTKAEVFQLLELVAEQLMPGALFIAGVGKMLQFLTRLAPALGGELYLTGQVGGAGVFVEQAAMGVGFQQ